MKRILGWHQSNWPIPQPLQAFAGMVPYRDPEAYADRKRAEAEAKAEREAIQAEAREAEAAIMPDAPELGADGWYRIGPTFYRLGTGPAPTFGPMRHRAHATPAAGPAVQLTMF